MTHSKLSVLHTRSHTHTHTLISHSENPQIIPILTIFQRAHRFVQGKDWGFKKEEGLPAGRGQRSAAWRQTGAALRGEGLNADYFCHFLQDHPDYVTTSELLNETQTSISSEERNREVGSR